VLVSTQQQTVFDAEFLTRLRKRDPAACTRFVFCFTPIIEAKLRHEFLDFGSIEDVRNETFYRVITLVDRDQVRDPAHFGSFVRGVCSRVAHEHRRKLRRTEPLDDEPAAETGRQQSLEGWLQDEELRKIVRHELSKLSEEDCDLITESYLEERDRGDMARARGVSPGGLNVRICRAMQRFRTQVLRNVGSKP
jgi:RNA polymerase sigma-70 factor (ECF subfamily)